MNDASASTAGPSVASGPAPTPAAPAPASPPPATPAPAPLSKPPAPPAGGPAKGPDVSKGASTPEKKPDATAAQSRTATESVTHRVLDNPFAPFARGETKMAKVKALKPFYERDGLHDAPDEVTVPVERAHELVACGYAEAVEEDAGTAKGEPEVTAAMKDNDPARIG